MFIKKESIHSVLSNKEKEIVEKIDLLSEKNTAVVQSQIKNRKLKLYKKWERDLNFWQKYIKRIKIQKKEKRKNTENGLVCLKNKLKPLTKKDRINRFVIKITV